MPYLNLSLDDGRKIASHYGIECQSIEAIQAGAENSNFYLKSLTAKYILTIFEAKQAAEVGQLAQLYDHLESHHFPAPIVVPQKDGKYLGEFQGKAYLLTKFIGGQSPLMASDKQISQMGKNLAALHLIETPQVIKKQPPYGLEWAQDFLSDLEDSQFEEWLSNKISSLDKGDWDDLPKGLIHGDLFLDNALFEDEKLSAFVDFEDACHYILAYDIGMTLLGCCEADGKISTKKANIFLGAYQSKRPLTSAEMRGLPIFVSLAAALISAWRYWKFNWLKAAPDKEEYYKEMMIISDKAQLLKWEKLLG